MDAKQIAKGLSEAQKRLVLLHPFWGAAEQRTIDALRRKGIFKDAKISQHTNKCAELLVCQHRKLEPRKALNGMGSNPRPCPSRSRPTRRRDEMTDRPLGDVMFIAHLQAEIASLRAERDALRVALDNIRIEAERPAGRWVHLKRVIALQCKSALGDDHAG